ncbi:DNA helicase [Paraconexibacter sp. AEG42_29]|uniref:DNA 3'-5' helicase n=1 Tax=Paraconexibacter sp. AEG42_29 TaxID=2997339 RepID=A0AAU7B2L9_9ACTN
MSAHIVPVDQAARDQIVTRLDRNACVEAGAGTGKTTVLVDRIVELLRTGTAGIDEIAVITFTEKAAAELSVRVRQRLEKALLDAAPGSSDEAVLRAALGGLHRARIETIHAFCGGLLRERPVEAGLDPQFEVVDQLGSQLDFDVAYDRWFTELLDGDDRRVAQALNRTMWPEHLRELAEILTEHRAVLPLAPVRVDDADLAGYLSVIDGVVDDIARLHEEFDLPEADAGIQQLPEIERWLDRVAEARGATADLERLLARAPSYTARGAQKHWDDAEGCKILKAAVNRLTTANVEACAALRTRAIADVLPLVSSFVMDFAEERRRTARLSFDDLLLWSRDLVAQHPDVREDFRRQFKAILVDEFQDTDPVQAELVLHLTSDGPETDPQKLVPAPGRLVVVGDPKQSIYRFRRADIAIYDAIKRGPLADDLLQISQNFRSADGILAWANDVFDRAFKEEAGKQPGNVPLQPSGLGVTSDRSPVVVIHGATEMQDVGETKLARRTQEARLLAATFTRAREEGWLIRDPDTGEERPAKWRDMAVLVPARTEVNLYEEAFAAAGVPLRHEGGKTFFRRQEVRELVSILHAIDDPTDRVALIASLRSPTFGCSDEELFLWTAAGGKWSYFSRLDSDDQQGPMRVREGLLLLRELHRARSGLSLPELVRRALDDTGAIEHALTRPDGRETAANLLKLVDQARDFSASGGGGLRAFTRWLARNRDEDSEETDAGISEDTDDVVRLITIHAAKGLEFPIVALANLFTRGSSALRPIPDAANHRIHLRLGTQKKSGWFTTPDLDAAHEAEKSFIAAERLRLLYVAVTRARDVLVVPWVGEKAEGMLETLSHSLPSSAEDAAGAEALGVSILHWTSLSLPPADAGSDSGAIPDTLPESEVQDAATAAARWESEHIDGIARASVELPVTTATGMTKPWRPVVASAESVDASLILGEGPPLALGDALHLVMERVDFPDASNLESVSHAICVEAEIPDHVDEVIKLARRCLASPGVIAASTADQVVRELPFTVPGPGGAGFVTGRADLVYRVGDEWTVVDYKTDGVPDRDLAAAAAHHEAQASAYMEAVRSVVGVVPRIVLVFARAGAEASFEPTSETSPCA